MPGRKTVGNGEYRFGFNGKEDDKDWGTQNVQDYGFRLYNPSIGKFLSVDPLAPEYPFYTPYQFAGNMPVWAIDRDGLEPEFVGSDGDKATGVADQRTGEIGDWEWFGGEDGAWDHVSTAESTVSSGSVEYSWEHIGHLNQEDLKTDPIYRDDVGNDYIDGLKFKDQDVDASGFGWGEEIALNQLKQGFFSATMFYDTWDDDKLINHFFNGLGTPLNFSTNSDMAGIIGDVKTFKNFALSFENAALNEFRSAGSLDGFDGNEFIRKNRPKYIGTFLQGRTGVFAYAVLGGYAEISAKITTVTANQIMVEYTIMDHYGDDGPDARRALPGLPDLYYLQYYHSEDNKYQPFIWTVTIGRTFTR